MIHRKNIDIEKYSERIMEYLELLRTTDELKWAVLCLELSSLKTGKKLRNFVYRHYYQRKPLRGLLRGVNDWFLL